MARTSCSRRDARKVIACEGEFRMNDPLDELARTLAALLGLLFAGAAGPAAADHVVVFAAASLEDAIDGVAADFQGFVLP